MFGTNGKKITLKLVGAQKYWAHAGLKAVIQKRSQWDDATVRNFLVHNEVVRLFNLDASRVAEVLDELEAAGFILGIQKGRDEIIATLALSAHDEVEHIKEGLFQLSERVLALGQDKSGQASHASLREHALYKELKRYGSSDQKPTDAVKALVTKKIRAPRATTEAAIGRYWLSGIGVFMLLLGVVFFVFCFSLAMGAIGKLSIATLIGAGLVMGGHYYSKKEKYVRWAMSAVGGGWAILYFTVFAAHHVKAVQIIHDPFIGFGLLLIIAACSIIDSLRFKSAVLIFMAYFLAYLSTMTTDVSWFTLVASYILAISIGVIMHKVKMHWLVVLGLVMVYMSHWIWVAPAISTMRSSFAGEERLWEAIILPWMGNGWRMYPLIDVNQSVLHLSFLVLYWILFTVIGSFRVQKEKAMLYVVLPTLILNALIFVSSVMHHLHVYYPHMKWMFTVAMGGIFYGLSFVEKKRKWPLMADSYLAFAIALFCLIVPMCFDGPVVTYGWTAMSVICVWMGFRQNNVLVRGIGLALIAVVMMRLVFWDYLERDIIFSVLMPVYPFFILAVTVSAVCYLLYRMYVANEKKSIAREIFVPDVAHSMAVCVFGMAVLMGGLRAASSCVFLLEGVYLMGIGITKKKKWFRVLSFVFLVVGMVRMVSLDFGIAFSKIFTMEQVAWRYVGCAISFCCVLAVLDWMREKAKIKEVESFYFKYTASMVAVLALFGVIDAALVSVLTLIWGGIAFIFTISGFWKKEKIYRMLGLILFGCVTCRLFFHDFAKLDAVFRVISFMGLGVVFIVASLVYNYYAKLLLTEADQTST